ncbi:hypothetical protein [Flavobacterium flavigenum]|uniref:hypothetical protein n=1 Tax=Flavobacterium flavigenum TaxID=3003258 RepID=UPI002482D828|nr:hypothetical protein [Flavobacterium flavigenum]
MRTLLSMLLTSVIIFSASSQNVKKSWLKVLENCGKSEIMGKNTVFFGPSNSIGLGSIWRKTEDKGYNPRFELAALFQDSLIRNRMIKLGTKAEKCTNSKNVKWNAKVNLAMLGPIFGLNGLDISLRNVRKTVVSVDNLALDLLLEVPFEQAIKNLATTQPENPFLQDILSHDGRLLVTKAYRLSALTVKLTYDAKDLEALKDKYPTGATINLGGESGLGFDVGYSSDKEMILTLSTDVYIAGELSRLSTNGTINLNNQNDLKLELIPIKVEDGNIVGKIEGLQTVGK